LKCTEFAPEFTWQPGFTRASNAEAPQTPQLVLDQGQPPREGAGAGAPGRDSSPGKGGKGFAENC